VSPSPTIVNDGMPLEMSPSTSMISQLRPPKVMDLSLVIWVGLDLRVCACEISRAPNDTHSTLQNA